jgi:streptogramin lyase
MRTQVRAVLVAAALGTAVTVSAAPASADPIAAIAMPYCCVTDTVGLGADVFALAVPLGVHGSEKAVLARIDPATNTVTGSLVLPPGFPTDTQFDTQALATGAGSIWVTAYFDDEVVRVDPQTMTITAQVPTGRSPDSIVYDGRSLWVALQNGHAVQRIDPARNAVVQTVRVGSKDSLDNPFQVAFDGTQVLASMPTSGRVARIAPSTGKVGYDQVGVAAAGCANLLPVSGGYWLDDTECSPSYYRWDTKKQRITATLDPTSPGHGDWGAAVVGGALYTSETDCGEINCTGGYLVKRDVATGAEISETTFGIEAFITHYAAGSFWVADFDSATLQRVAAF